MIKTKDKPKTKKTTSGELLALCAECGQLWHPLRFEVCWRCFAKRPANWQIER